MSDENTKRTDSTLRIVESFENSQAELRKAVQEKKELKTQLVEMQSHLAQVQHKNLNLYLKNLSLFKQKDTKVSQKQTSSSLLVETSPPDIIGQELPFFSSDWPPNETSLTSSNYENEWKDSVGHIMIRASTNGHQLNSHQVGGIYFLFKRILPSTHDGGGCILGCPVGSGKSAIILRFWETAHFKCLNDRRLLILCPKVALDVWKSQADEWLDFSNRICLVIIDRSIKLCKPRKELVRKWHESKGILVTTYGIWKSILNTKCVPESHQPALLFLQQALLDPGPDILALDEGHVIKNKDTILNVLLSRVVTSRKILISGTAFQNNVKEFHSLLNFVMPGILGSNASFRNTFQNKVKRGANTNDTFFNKNCLTSRAHEFQGLISHLIYRCPQGIRLPAQEEWVLYLKQSHIQQILYTKFVQQQFSCEGFQNISECSLFEAEATISKLLCHPDITYNKYLESISPENTESGSMSWASEAFQDYQKGNLVYGVKFNVAIEILKAALKLGRKTLIFSYYLAVLDELEIYLNNIKLEGCVYHRLDGTTSDKNREKYIQEINRDTNVNLLLITSKSGAEATSITGASITIILDVHWNPSVDVQAAGRMRRLNSTRSGIVYRLVVQDSLDAYKSAKQISKICLGRQLVDGRTCLLSSMSLPKNAFSYLHIEIHKKRLPQKPKNWNYSSDDFPSHINELVNRIGRQLASVPKRWESFLQERRANSPSKNEIVELNCSGTNSDEFYTCKLMQNMIWHNNEKEAKYFLCENSTIRVKSTQGKVNIMLSNGDTSVLHNFGLSPNRIDMENIRSILLQRLEPTI